MARSDFRFVWHQRARYAEVDAQAVVFNSRYLEYFDIGITEYFRAVGLYPEPQLKGAPELHVVKAEVTYHAPVLLDEMMAIGVRCEKIGRTSLTFAFEIHGEGGEDLRASGIEVSVHVDEPRGRPTPVPDAVVALFEAYAGRVLK
ncbi:4-hydroxybenzoyl-CoA thioesterase [Sandarakinorhabdus cyanobacteriorum]|uniref:4-hydroxybenzoyl-CoA thioesterase n=1 Tax=Sandarakinorhabdus cyanobacteriorum TaxID=1981098 RepID=A0A255YCX5_9SPHN|nr:thioesterase family protein [Sandarakinorhabdus cyanobacteriorum]OYQ27048.1 4-hydroxybenzoyl-CoA thioesterase [Sandarakinorhabdus cyanobacteriorum]